MFIQCTKWQRKSSRYVKLTISTIDIETVGTMTKELYLEQAMYHNQNHFNHSWKVS